MSLGLDSTTLQSLAHCAEDAVNRIASDLIQLSPLGRIMWWRAQSSRSCYFFVRVRDRAMGRREVSLDWLRVGASFRVDLPPNASMETVAYACRWALERDTPRLLYTLQKWFLSDPVRGLVGGSMWNLPEPAAVNAYGLGKVCREAARNPDDEYVCVCGRLAFRAVGKDFPCPTVRTLNIPPNQVALIRCRGVIPGFLPSRRGFPLFLYLESDIMRGRFIIRFGAYVAWVVEDGAVRRFVVE